jgi:hypothetical protein
VLDTPVVRAGVIETKCTARVSPGSASSTKNGPFRRGAGSVGDCRIGMVFVLLATVSVGVSLMVCMGLISRVGPLRAGRGEGVAWRGSGRSGCGCRREWRTGR